MSSRRSTATFGILFCLATATPAAATTLIFHQTGIAEGALPGFKILAGEIDFTGSDVPTIAFTADAMLPNHPFPTIDELNAAGLTGLEVVFTKTDANDARSFSLADLTFGTGSLQFNSAPGPVISLLIHEGVSSRDHETLEIGPGSVRITADNGNCSFGQCSAIGEWPDPPSIVANVAAAQTVPEPGSLGLLMVGLFGLGLRRILGSVQRRSPSLSLTAPNWSF